VDAARLIQRILQLSRVPEGRSLLPVDALTAVQNEAARLVPAGLAIPPDQADDETATAASVVVSATSVEHSFWPMGVIPYYIDPSYTMPDPNNPSRTLADAGIEYWNKVKKVRFRPYRNGDPYWVRIVSSSPDDCRSYVGRKPGGGGQRVYLGSNCQLVQVIHELGHVVGLFHEQSRNDRDNYLVIHREFIQQGLEGNFDLVLENGTDVGPFDFGSIMLYPPNAFSVGPGNPSFNTMEALPRWVPLLAGRTWGITAPNITGLSPLDVRGVASMYPNDVVQADVDANLPPPPEAASAPAAAPAATPARPQPAAPATPPAPARGEEAAAPVAPAPAPPPARPAPVAPGGGATPTAPR
jgi:hypothetical protein